MIKSQLIARMAKKLLHVPEKDVAKSINALLECMSAALARGERIEVRDFGSFSTHYHPPRKARNPKTGETVMTEGKHVPRFKAGKALRERVLQAREHNIPIQEFKDDEKDEEE